MVKKHFIKATRKVVILMMKCKCDNKNNCNKKCKNKRQFRLNFDLYNYHPNILPIIHLDDVAYIVDKGDLCKNE